MSKIILVFVSIIIFTLTFNLLDSIFTGVSFWENSTSNLIFAIIFAVVEVAIITKKKK